MNSWNPAQYEKFKSERDQPFHQLLKFLEPTTNPRVIDLGCGTGKLTGLLHNTVQAQSTLGIDCSPAMLAQTESLAGGGLSFRQETIENFLENPSAGKVDIVFSNAALQWCSDHPMLIGQIRDLLAPQGQCALQMPFNHLYPTHTVARDIARSPKFASLLGRKPRPHNVLAPEDYGQLFFDLGFKEHRIEMKVFGHVLRNREETIEWVKGSLLTFYESKLSKTDYQEFLNAYQVELLKVLPDTEPFYYPFKRIFVWGML